MDRSKVIPGRTYKHFKGNLYKVVGIAQDTETGDEYVIYHNINEDKLWARPIEMFCEKVNVSEKTELISDDDYIVEHHQKQVDRFRLIDGD